MDHRQATGPEDGKLPQVRSKTTQPNFETTWSAAYRECGKTQKRHRNMLSGSCHPARASFAADDEHVLP